jgi:hypothetical protein
MLKTLQSTVNSPQKKVLMAGIIAILLYGIKWAKQKPPTDVKNMKNETGSKVKTRFDVITFRLGQRKRQRRPSFLEASDDTNQKSNSRLVINRSSLHSHPLSLIGRAHHAEHLACRCQRQSCESYRRDELDKLRPKSKRFILRNLTQFQIFQLFLFAVPSSTVNAGIDYLNLKLALRFRKRLT